MSRHIGYLRGVTPGAGPGRGHPVSVVFTGRSVIITEAVGGIGATAGVPLSAVMTGRGKQSRKGGFGAELPRREGGRALQGGKWGA
ncbi:MAG: hypothetical protein GX147_07630 [Deltaproteobacteria bacterium]|nr:hypothetical protein [Deltaproteobacteria bacterium]